MNISYYIARRYLFAKKSRNVINIISGISMFVVAAVTVAMITVLSTFNGIETLVQDLFSNFDAEITILPQKGKTFAAGDSLESIIKEVDGIAIYCEVIEDDAWLKYRDQNTVATVKGVDSTYASMNNIDSMMYQGTFQLWDADFPMAVPGSGVRRELGLPFREGEGPIFYINAPIRGKKLSKHKENAFNTLPIQLAGAFSVNAELDVKYVIVPIEFARQLFDYDLEVSSIEINGEPGIDLNKLRDDIKAKLGPNYIVKTRYEKNALVYQTNQSEKWATYLIMVFILCIAAFNIAASLTMLIIEKKRDIHILMSMGATRESIRWIFTFEGVLINAIGAVSGLVLGIGLCLLQQHVGLVRLEGAMVEFYPVEIRWLDVLGVFITVCAIGSLFSLFIVKYLVKRYALRYTANE